MREVWLVGESNPYNPDPEYALYPFPRRSAGGRLCRNILKVLPFQFIRFKRANLLEGTKWSAPKARVSAQRLLAVVGARDRLVLLGARVTRAFGLPFRPFTLVWHLGRLWLVLPHPSGRSRVWNGPKAAARARGLVRAVCGRYAGHYGLA